MLGLLVFLGRAGKLHMLRYVVIGWCGGTPC
jgi:hypothetical protein